MRYVFFLVIFMTTFHLPALAQDNDHLWPENSIYTISDLLPDDYIFQRLEKVFEANIRARALVYPSGRPEYVIAIRENIELVPVTYEGDQFPKSNDVIQVLPNTSTYELLFLTFEHRLFDFEYLADLKGGAIRVLGEDNSWEIDQQKVDDLEAELPASKDEVALIECVKDIEPDFAETMLNVWRKILLETRYSDPQPQRFHRGNTYHFAYKEDYIDVFGYPTYYAGYTHGPISGTKTRQLANITELLRDFCSEQNSATSSSILEVARKLDDRLNATLSGQ